MTLKKWAIAAAMLPLVVGCAAVLAQAGNPATPAHPATATPAAPVATAPAASPASAPTVASPTDRPSDTSSPASSASCQGGNCDQPQPHITIATPAPAPAPWPLQERISWAANLILVLIAYLGVMLAVSTLRKIERQTRYAEAAAQAAAESAKAALQLAQAQERAERPWIVVTPEPMPGIPDSFTVVAANRGRGPARIVSLADEIATAHDELQLPSAPAFRSEPRPPRVPIILLPGETTGIKSFRRDDVKSVCETAEDLRRVEEWEMKIYLYGAISYADLRSADEKQVHETTWCCWYVHGRQKSGMVMAGPPEYNRHT